MICSLSAALHFLPDHMCVFQIFDTGLDPVKIVCAAPASILVNGELPRDRRIVVASEYENLSRRWLRDQKVPHIFRRTFGATEVFPPEDADCIIDNTATGTTLKVGLNLFFLFWHCCISSSSSSSCLIAGQQLGHYRQSRIRVFHAHGGNAFASRRSGQNASCQKS